MIPTINQMMGTALPIKIPNLFRITRFKTCCSPFVALVAVGLHLWLWYWRAVWDKLHVVIGHHQLTRHKCLGMPLNRGISVSAPFLFFLFLLRFFYPPSQWVASFELAMAAGPCHGPDKTFGCGYKPSGHINAGRFSKFKVNSVSSILNLGDNIPCVRAYNTDVLIIYSLS